MIIMKYCKQLALYLNYVKGCPSALLLVAVAQTNGEFTGFDYVCIRSSVDRCMGYLFVVLALQLNRPCVVHNPWITISVSFNVVHTHKFLCLQLTLLHSGHLE